MSERLSWAIIEIFGHQQIAGKVTEACIGGCSFVRVDVPEVDGSEPYTKFYGNGAIYSMTPTTEVVARAWLQRHRQEAISVWGLNLVPKALPEAKGPEGDDPLYVMCPYCGYKVPAGESRCHNDPPALAARHPGCPGGG